jgi:Kef-type K+ transport system membrane component KefB
VKRKNNIFYIILVSGLTLLIWFLLGEGKQLEAGKLTGELLKGVESGHWLDPLSHNLLHPFSILILQIITIIFVARFFGILFKKIGQPTVVGEILAGILLGPSLLGWLLPDVSSFLFPATSLANLQFLSQIGLLLFMFTIGLELDPSKLRLKAHEAVIISHASILIPFFLGVILSLAIYREFAPADVKFSAFALFIGISMSITAFPVLARIVQERGLSKKPIGAMVITCAAADDVTAWCMLAVVIAIVKATSVASALLTIGLAIAYVLAMLMVVKPLMAKIGQRYSTKEAIGRPIVALVFSIMLVSSWLTEVIGIHALFGAFLAGIVMPQQLDFKRIITEKIEDVALVLLLPLFFVFTGLRTQIGLLNDPYLWMVCLGVTGVAIAGKLAGSAIAAKYVGMSWRDSLSIGALMNSRGLMELVVLNIGYDMGVLSPEIFAMLVLMALITTFMTGPALDLIEKYLPERTEQITEAVQTVKVLISFGKAEMGKTLLHLAHLFTPSKERVEYTALHISPR